MMIYDQYSAQVHERIVVRYSDGEKVWYMRERPAIPLWFVVLCLAASALVGLAF